MAKTFSALAIELNAVLVLSDTVDPTAGAGVVAPIGSLYVRAGTAQVWQKTGAGDTAWTQLATTVTGNPQRFIYNADGSEGVSFDIPLPADRGNINYVAMVVLANQPGGLYNVEVPTSGYQTNAIHVNTGAPVANGDAFAVVVEDLT